MNYQIVYEDGAWNVWANGRIVNRFADRADAEAWCINKAKEDYQNHLDQTFDESL